MPKLNVQQNNANIIKAFKVALETSHGNLLDNWYFVGGGSQLGDGVFPINQRGLTSYTGSTYTIDRWVIDSSAITVSLNAGYLELSGTAGNNFSQVIAPEAANALYGETVTASALMYDGTILTGTGIFPARPASGWNFIGLAYGTDVALIIGTNLAGRSEFFIQTQSASAKVCAVKLELGTVSTLANDAPPDFGEELRKCQRYLWVEKFPENTIISSGLAFNTSSVFDFITPVPMRLGAAIQITFTVTPYITYGTNNLSIAGGTSTLTSGKNGNHLRVQIGHQNNYDLGNLTEVHLLCGQETTMVASCEI